MSRLIETMATEYAGDRDGMDTEWLDEKLGCNDDVVDVITDHDMVRYCMFDGSAIVELPGGWDVGIHHDWLEDPHVHYAIMRDKTQPRRPEFVWPLAGSAYLSEQHTGPKITAVVEKITEVWQRNLMVNGWHRRCEPVAKADVIMGVRGDLWDVLKVAKLHANESLVSVSVRTDDDLYIVNPDD